MKRTNKGFTLVELIIVIAVIGVLAAILIPVFANVIEKANRKSAYSDARNAISLYVAEATTGQNGGDVFPNGAYVKVVKASKNWYFKYENNGLKDYDDDSLIHNDSTYTGATGSEYGNTQYNQIPTHVTIKVLP